MVKKKVRALQKSTEFEPQAGSVRWDVIREDYIAQNLVRAKGQPPYNLKALSAAHGISYHYIRQIAGTQKWNKLLKERVEERNRQAVEQITGVALFDEIEIRTRQATYARLASSIAHAKLNGLDQNDIKKLSVRDAIELLRIGLAEERTALGLDKGGTPPAQPEDRSLSDQQVFAVARRVIEMRRGDDGSFSPETER
jgi:hypothetical protein